MQLPHHLSTMQWLSPLGPMRLAASDEALVGVWFEGQKHAPSDALIDHWTDHASDSFRSTPYHDAAVAVLQKTCTQLTQYFAKTRTAFDLPLALSCGTAFEQAVWQTLLSISIHQRLTYGEVAKRIGKPRAVRAVGVAIGKNPICIIVPCHRVVGADGSLTGYAGGLARKAALLAQEAQM